MVWQGSQRISSWVFWRRVAVARCPGCSGSKLTIEKALGEASSALGLRARVALGSQTQPRQVYDQIIGEAVTPGPIRSIQPLMSMRELAQRATASDPASVMRAKDSVKSELADLLTRQNPQEMYRGVTEALAARPFNPALGNDVQNAVTLGGFTALPESALGLQRTLGTLPAIKRPRP